MATERGADPIEGVSHSQYAAVLAASAEGHGLAEAQAWAGVAASAWTKAAPAWRRALLDGATRVAHHRELAKAEDRLHRRVPPIEEDAAAWVAFMTCVAEAPDVIALLAKLDLGPNDVSRLTRAWARRMADDPAVRKRIADLHGQVPALMPAVRPAPRVPLAPAAREGPKAPVEAEAPAPPPPTPAALPAPAVTPALPTYLAQVDLHVAAAEAPAPPPDAGSGMTLDVSQVWKSGAVLPFAGPREGEPASGPADRPADAAAPPTESHASGATVDVSEVWKSGGALPFPVSASGSGATVDVSEAWKRGAAVPFAPTPAAAGPAGELSMERYASLCVELALDAGHAADTLARYGIDARGKDALDATWGRRFAGSPEERAAFDRARAAYRAWLDAHGSAAAPPSTGPRFSLEQYASLVVDLTVAPARAAETLGRYGLAVADKEALDAAWRARLTDDRERSAFDRACATYRAWLEAGKR